MRDSSSSNATAWTRLGDGVVRETAVSGLLVLSLQIAAALILQRAANLPGGVAPIAAGAFMLVLFALLAVVSSHHPHRHFGAANQVTLMRTAVTLLLLGFVGAGAEPRLAWWVVGIAAVAACMDALDGPLARRHGTVSAFGARFDMEVDAAFILILCVLAWQFEKAGAWVLVSGLMRYAFILASLLCPWLRLPLPASVRRQSVCVAQVVVLIVCLSPLMPAPWSKTLAALGLAALAVSFATDIAWLYRRAR